MGVYKFSMRIKVTDITAEGRDLSFDLENESLNSRIAAARDQSPVGASTSQSYSFEGSTHSELRLTLEGSTVVIKGMASGKYVSLCSRCVESCETSLLTDVQMLLKPRQPGGPEGSQDEDLQFGFYEDGEVDCGSIVEECIILALPLTVICSEDCKGLCAQCGGNLNQTTCSCAEDSPGDERFAVLKGLKVVQ